MNERITIAAILAAVLMFFGWIVPSPGIWVLAGILVFIFLVLMAVLNSVEEDEL